MSKKLIYLISFVLVLGLAGNTMAEDLSVPYWAGAPDSTYAIWEFEEDAVPGPRDDAWLATEYVGDEENHIQAGDGSIWYIEGTGGDELAAFATPGVIHGLTVTRAALA